MVDFLIYYETLQREYENAMLMKIELERRGYSVRVLNTVYADYFKSYFIRPRVIVGQTVRNERNLHFFTHGSLLGAKKVVNLQYEQVLTKMRESSDFDMPDGKAVNVFQVCWGDHAYNNLLRHGFKEEMLRKTGAMQFDLLRKEFDGYFKSKSEIAKEYGMDENTRWVLFNASFVYASFSEKRMAEIKKENPFAEKTRNNMVNAQREIMKWTDEMLSKHPEITFIYRPHPSEKETSVVREVREKHPNFHYIGEKSVKQWIKVSDTINVWHSTSGMEAYYAGKQIYVVRPYELPLEQDIPIYEGGKKITSCEEYINVNCNARLETNKTEALNLQRIEDYYGKKEEIPSYKKVCDFLEDVLKGEYKNQDVIVKSTAFYIKRELKYALVTLYVEFVMKTKIKLSKILPFKKKALEGWEVSAQRFDRKNLKKVYEDRIREFVTKNFEQ